MYYNNIFASNRFDKIIDEIHASSFAKGTTFIPPNPLDIAVEQLRSNWNNRAYIRLAVRLLNAFVEKQDWEPSKRCSTQPRVKSGEGGRSFQGVRTERGGIFGNDPNAGSLHHQTLGRRIAQGQVDGKMAYVIPRFVRVRTYFCGCHCRQQCFCPQGLDFGVRQSEESIEIPLD